MASEPAPASSDHSLRPILIEAATAHRERLIEYEEDVKARRAAWTGGKRPWPPSGLRVACAWSASMPNMLVEIVDDCVLLVHSKQDPTTEEWKDYLDLLDRSRAVVHKMCVVSEGGAPSPKQRKDVTELTNAKYPAPIKTAVVTTAAAARGVVTAISWFYKDIKAFAPASIDDAFLWLNLQPKQIAEIKKRMVGMKMRVAAGQ